MASPDLSNSPYSVNCSVDAVRTLPPSVSSGEADPSQPNSGYPASASSDTTFNTDRLGPAGSEELAALGNETARSLANCFNWSDTLEAANGLNSSTNATSSLYNFYEAEQFAVLWLLLLSIVIGNTAVIVALRLSKSRKSRTNFFIMHLALADLLVGLISVLTDLVWKITIQWHAGNVACKIIRFAQILVTYSSTYVLVALSIDRYDAITHPMNFSGSWKRARQLVAAAWGLSAVFASPSLCLFKETIVEGMAQCWISFPEPWHWQLYLVLVSVTLFILPCLLISACYIIIVYTIWSKSKMMMGGMRQKPLAAAAATAAAPVILSTDSEKRRVAAVVDEDSRRASSRGLIPKAKIKTVKMTLVIVLVFIICWSPYIVFDLLQVFGYVPHTPTNIAVATFIQSLAPLNSAANPIIYCLFSTRLCRNLRRLPAVDWLARNACPWCACLQEPLDGPFQRRTTEYTTMTDSHRPNSTSVRYHAARFAATNTITRLDI